MNKEKKNLTIFAPNTSNQEMLYNRALANVFTKAFTLAEVLITLAIIGVVAAMAIPSVISNASLEMS